VIGDETVRGLRVENNRCVGYENVAGCPVGSMPGIDGAWYLLSMREIAGFCVLLPTGAEVV
jgi:hypothetical protein